MIDRKTEQILNKNNNDKKSIENNRYNDMNE